MRGHLRQRGKQKLWYIVVDERDPASGQRRRRWIATGCTNKHKAEEKLVEVLSEAQRGPLPAAKQETLATYLRRWLNDTAAVNLRRRSHEQYVLVVEQHLIPALGSLRLGELRPDHIQAYYARKLAGDGERRPLSRATVQVHHAVLHTALKQAVRWGALGSNPADAATPPRARRQAPQQTLTAAQAAAFVQAAAADRMHALYALEVTTGLRRGELLGLRWSDLDLETGLLTVRQALTKIKGGTTFEPTKSHRSDRPVEIARGLCELLARHRADQVKERERAGPLWQEYGLLFCLEDGRPIPPSTLDRHYHALLQRAGLPRMRLHDLRHTQATLLLAQGVHPKVVQERLGHSSITMTMDLYSHVIPGLQRAAAEKLDEVLFGPRGGLTVELDAPDSALLLKLAHRGERPGAALSRLIRVAAAAGGLQMGSKRAPAGTKPKSSQPKRRKGLPVSGPRARGPDFQIPPSAPKI